MSHPQRKVRLDLFTPAEMAIHNAMVEVEKLGADPKLTDTIIILQNAKEVVQNYIIPLEDEKDDDEWQGEGMYPSSK